jgi:hypothetical protein
MADDNTTRPAPGSSPTLGAWRRSPEAAEERELWRRRLSVQLTADVTATRKTAPVLSASLGRPVAVGETVTMPVGRPLTPDEIDEFLRREGYDR